VKGERINQFVGKLNAFERGKFRQPFMPEDRNSNVSQEGGLQRFRRRKRFDDSALDGFPERRVDRSEDVGEQLSIVGTLLNDGEGLGASEDFPHLMELLGKHLSEGRADTYACVEVPTAADSGSLRIVSALRIIKGDLHEGREGNPALPAD